MAIRILAQSIYPVDHPTFTGEGYAKINQGAAAVYRKVLHPDTIVDARFVSRSSFYTSHSYLEMLNNAEIVQGIIGGEGDHYDVAFVRCGNDPGIREARESVRIPVVGMSEAAMHLACQLGSKFAMIGVDAKSAPLVERNLRLFGLENRAIAVRPVRMPHDPNWNRYLSEAPKWFESSEYVWDKIVPAFDAVARQCIDEGAEVIITACALFSALTLAGYNKVTGTEVPVLESVAVGIKAAEMMGGLYRSLGLSTSKHLTYQNLLTPDMRTALTAPYFSAVA